MSESKKKHKRHSYFEIINLFAEKSELLAVEAYSIFNVEREICKIIGIIIIHQAVELALKALCLHQGIMIFIKGDLTLSFPVAMNKIKGVITDQDKKILRILHIHRNSYQHSAIFDISRINKWLVIDALSIINEILDEIGCKSNEINLILELSDLADRENNGQEEVV